MTSPVDVDVLIVRLDPDLPIPAQAHPGDAGFDLRARTSCEVAPGARVLVPTGVAIALPAGVAGFIHPRSGLAIKSGLTVVNAPGTIDAGYRGEICVALVNLDPQSTASIARGDRIAQLIVAPVFGVRWHEVATLPGSARGEGGFGSTGVRG